MKGVPITDDIFASDLMNESFPYRFSMGEALQSGHWPLWVREIYGGFPLLARSEAGVCYPINIILFGLLAPYVALNITILVIVATAAVGMYFYAREIRNGHIASTLAGIAFGFCGHLAVHLRHLSIANVACWVPIGLLLIERSVKRNICRPLLWFGFVLGLQHLAGNAQSTYYACILYSLYFASRCLNNQSDATRSSMKKSSVWGVVRGVLKSPLTWSFIGVVILATLMGAIQLLPTYELVSHSQRANGVSFEYASKYAYDPSDFWTFFYPLRNGDIGNLTYSGKGVFWEDYGYVGVGTIFLAIYASLRHWRDWHVRFFSFCACASYLCVLGPATPIYKIVFDYAPGMRFFRFPTRLLLITDVSLIALASLGLTKLADRLQTGALSNPSSRFYLGSSWRARLAFGVPVVLLAVTVFDLLYFQLRQNPIVDAALWLKPPQTVGILRQDPTLWRMYCLGGNHAHRRMFERAQGWEGSLQPFVDQREFIQPSSNVLYGIASPNGYANLTPNYIVDIWGDQNRAGLITRSASIQGNVFTPAPLFWKLMRMYNVKYLTSFWPLASASNLDPMGVYGDAYLYRYNDYLPRSYLVNDVITVPEQSSDTALRVLSSDAFQPARSVILPVTPPGFRSGESAPGDVEVVRYTVDEAEMKVQTAQSAILVFSDSYYPGWIADVDGRDTTVYRANVTQRAVVVPGGEHHVRFRFEPRTVKVGLWISLGSLVVFLLLYVFPWIRKSERIGGGETAPNLPD